MAGPGSSSGDSPDAIRVSAALSDRYDSTDEVGSDATNNMGSTLETAKDMVKDAAGDALRTAMGEEEGEEGGSSTPLAGGSSELKEVTLRTAPQDARFPTTNQSRRCYVAYNEYHKCIKERGKDSGDCKPYMRAYRSICPDEWIEKWQELRDNGAWYGKY